MPAALALARPGATPSTPYAHGAAGSVAWPGAVVAALLHRTAGAPWERGPHRAPRLPRELGRAGHEPLNGIVGVVGFAMGGAGAFSGAVSRIMGYVSPPSAARASALCCLTGPLKRQLWRPRAILATTTGPAPRLQPRPRTRALPRPPLSTTPSLPPGPRAARTPLPTPNGPAGHNLPHQRHQRRNGNSDGGADGTFR